MAGNDDEDYRAWRDSLPTPRPESVGCFDCGGIGIVAVTDTGEVSWLTPGTPGEDWEACICRFGESS